MICALLLVRGLIEVYVGTAEIDTTAYYQFDTTGYYYGVADIIFGLGGACAIAAKSPAITAAFVAWLGLRVVIEVLGALLVTVWYWPADLYGYLAASFFIVQVLFDVYFVVFGIDLLLTVTFQGTVSPLCAALLSNARRLALACGDTSCDKAHLIYVLLQDPVSSRLLQLGGADLDHIQNQLPNPFSSLTVATRVDESKAWNWVVPLAADADSVMRAATTIQQLDGDKQLTVDHVLLALCVGGQLSIPSRNGGVEANAPNKCAIDDRAIKEHLAQMRLAENAYEGEHEVVWEHRKLGKHHVTVVFGFLPLEPTVLTWCFLKIAAAVCLGLLAICVWICVAFGVLDWEHDVFFRGAVLMETKRMEAVGRVLGLVFGFIGARGIFTHTKARELIEDKAAKLDVPESAGLRKCFEALRGDQEAPTLLKSLKFGAACMKILFYWNLIELVIEVPILGMKLMMDNVCGVYLHSLYAASAQRGASNVHVQCSEVDKAAFWFFLWEVAGCAVQLFFTWLIYVLWHKYQHGWTSAEPNDFSTLHPCTALPDSISRNLAGLPRYVARFHDPHGEAKPLLL